LSCEITIQPRAGVSASSAGSTAIGKKKPCPPGATTLNSALLTEGMNALNRAVPGNASLSVGDRAEHGEIGEELGDGVAPSSVISAFLCGLVVSLVTSAPRWRAICR
jgi:hypothetical protein